MTETIFTQLGRSITAVIGLVAAALTLLLVITLAFLLVPRTRTTTPRPAIVVKSLRPTTQQLERLSELTSMRVNIVDVLQAEGAGHRGLWLIKGDALLSCDMSKAQILIANEEQRAATIRLPTPRCVSPRVDHEKTKIWSIEKSSWLPWKWGDKDELREAAMYHAQKLVAEAASSPQNVSHAQTHADLLIRRTYEMVGWHVVVEWPPDARH
jgi:hypothetical protein